MWNILSIKKFSIRDIQFLSPRDYRKLFDFLTISLPHLASWNHKYNREQSKRLHTYPNLLSDECDGFASATSSGGPAHPVYVVLGVCGDVKVDNHIHVWNVQPSTTQSAVYDR